MLACRLCSNFTAGETRDVWNEPLFQSDNFVVLPSLGALIEGWLLIVPRCHAISVGALDSDLRGELNLLKVRFGNQLQAVYGYATAFEHGPSTERRAVGCGVDHAHLHLVPAAFDVVAASTQFMPEATCWEPGNFDTCKQAFEAGLDYLYVEQPIGSGRIAVNQAFESQVIRRGIASRLDRLNQYNWRDYPQMENVERTVVRFTGLARSE